MKAYLVTIRTPRDRVTTYTAIAGSSAQAALDAASVFGDEPCGITVTCLE